MWRRRREQDARIRELTDAVQALTDHVTELTTAAQQRERALRRDIESLATDRLIELVDERTADLVERAERELAEMRERFRAAEKWTPEEVIEIHRAVDQRLDFNEQACNEQHTETLLSAWRKLARLVAVWDACELAPSG
ncbi:hypothetical protein DEF23_23215 [Marinitenerispora sediminis]|uniref:Uncharacterized protein n=2 Tax=Marinitenerispora sediminis TaxID=1931232 RepID=A0A368T6J2_9ACTN|nr:hypothetical protein DEF23_23215 [Marinitenerispora sediminis]RCV59268.1 hypothetical protein DEF24_09860 [Marinitenerispora sediminis]